MSLLDELKLEEVKPICCKVGEWFEGLDPAEQKGFLDWVQAGKSRRGLFRASKRREEGGLECAWTTFCNHILGHTDVS